MPKIMDRRQTMFANQDEEKKVSKSSGRVKKTKVPFDPSDANYPKRRQTICFHDAPKTSKNSSVKVTSAPKLPRALQPCSAETCNQTKKGIPFIKCSSDNDCPNRIHLVCLKTICTNFLKGEELNWRCEICETCEVCYETALIATLYKCYVCMSVFHKECHDTEITDADIVYRNRFRCSQCAMRAPAVRPSASHSVANTRRSSEGDFEGFSDVELKDVGNIRNVEQPKTDDPFENAGPLENAGSLEDAVIPPISRDSVSSINGISINYAKYPYSFGVPFSQKVPDASSWTCDEVYTYFCGYLGSKEAQVFKEQQIDGNKLLLLKRKDVLSNFKLKVGPALRIYPHVLRLQTGINDERMSWR